MKPSLPRTLSAVPQTLHARLEIAKAIRTLTGPDENELLRQRRAEITAIRHDLEALTREIRKVGEECLALAKAELRKALEKYKSDRPTGLTAAGYVSTEANAKGEKTQTFHKYNADEPRVPKGHPDGGQWTRVAASNDPKESSDAPQFQEHGEGHHWVPEAVLKKFKLRNDTRKVLEDATSGALADPTVNWFTREHRIYNDAVEKAFRDFLTENGITDEQMSPEQAEVLYRRIRGSNDPVIGGLNRKIIRQRLRYIEYFYLRGGGDEQ